MSVSDTTTALLASPGTLDIAVPVETGSDPVYACVSVADDSSAGNLQIGATTYLITVLDSTGTSVTAYDPPLTFAFFPSSDELAAAGGDMSSMPVESYDATTAAYSPVPSTLNDDGSVTFALSSLSPPASAAEDNAAPVEDAAGASDDSPGSSQ
jgi:hypothetical protein